MFCIRRKVSALEVYAVAAPTHHILHWRQECGRLPYEVTRVWRSHVLASGNKLTATFPGRHACVASKASLVQKVTHV